MADDERQDENRPEGAAGGDDVPAPEHAGAREAARPDDAPAPEAAEGEDAPAPEAADAEDAPAPEAPDPESLPAPETGEAEDLSAPEAVGEDPLPEGTAEGGEPEGDGTPEDERPPRGRRAERGDEDQADVIPGAHLEPDLVLEEAASTEVPPYAAEYEGAEYPAEADTEAAAEAPAEAPEEAEPAPAAAEDGAAPEADRAPAPRTPRDLAADARYQATGKRKTSVARVILRPGTGAYTVNGRPLDEAFPRVTLQHAARQPLETAGYASRMDVVARIHGGGVAAQAGALRHGVARALVEADPNLRGDLKRRGFLTRDARAKERKKAGLKKARKRPQFSKR